MSDASIPSSDALLETANRLADQAAKTSAKYFRVGVKIDLKGDRSPVTIADKQIEREAREVLAQAYPDHSILGEEYGAGDLAQDHVWVIDPIDGTRSFISGHPLYGFLLAHMHKGKCALGMIGIPELDERYIGQRGQGATLNGQRISTSDKTDLSEAILYVNEADKIARHTPGLFAKLVRIGHTRRFSYDCYPHALLASGLVDIVVDYDLKPFDYLPLTGVIEEAGGVITDWNGRPLSYDSDGRVLSAATPELHRAMIAILQGGRNL